MATVFMRTKEGVGKWEVHVPLPNGKSVFVTFKQKNGEGDYVAFTSMPRTRPGEKVSESEGVPTELKYRDDFNNERTAFANLAQHLVDSYGDEPVEKFYVDGQLTQKKLNRKPLIEMVNVEETPTVVVPKSMKGKKKNEEAAAVS